MNDTCAYCEKDNLSEVYFDMTCEKCVNRMFKIVTATSSQTDGPNNQPQQDVKCSLMQGNFPTPTDHLYDSRPKER